MLKKLLLAGFAFCGAAVVMDVTAAFVYRQLTGHSWVMPQEQIEKLYRIRSDTYHHDLAPMKSVVARWGSLTARVKTDSLGFRDFSCRQVPLSNSTHRILLIGDSFTEGVGVEYLLTFAGRITETLGKRGEEVLNAAAASYSPIIYWRKIEHLLNVVGLCFDEVVVFVDMSDANDNADEYRLNAQGCVESVGDSQTNSLPQKLEGMSRFGEWIDRNTILLQRVLAGRREARRASTPAAVDRINEWRGRWTTDPYVYTNYGARGLAWMDLYMSRLDALLRERGIPLTVVVYPWPAQVLEGDLDSVQVSYWRDWCARKNARFLNLFPCFVQGRTPGDRRNMVNQYYVKGDVHWNEKGHERVAQAFLESRDFATSEPANSSPCQPPADAAVSTRAFITMNSPSDFSAQYHLAGAFYALGFRDDAVFHYRKALAIDTNSVLALNDLAWVLATSAPSPGQDRGEPARLAERAVALANDGNPSLLDTLAVAYAFEGRMDESAAMAQKAREAVAKFQPAGRDPNQRPPVRR